MSSNYQSDQEKYMDSFHVPDSCSSQWEDTLYCPLRTRIIPLIRDSLEAGATSFAYVGPGPKTPLTENQEIQTLLSCFRRVVLYDISKRYLEQAKARVKPFIDRNAMLETKVHDVTRGLGEHFHDWLYKYKRNRKYPYFNLSHIPSNHFVEEKIDLVYSELVATYTGVPALFSFEQRTKLFIEDFPELIESWQYYNRHVASNHIDELLSWLRPNGNVVVATDIEKRYIGSPERSILSFGDSNPLRKSTRLIDLDETIMWDDTLVHQQKTSSFRPHHHLVGFYVYR